MKDVGGNLHSVNEKLLPYFPDKMYLDFGGWILG